jgi:SAM-dependent methyltransferase
VPERTRLADADLAAAWEAGAEQWIAWARAPGHDSYWTFNRDAFLALVPPPGRRTLDLGCGEGRLSRDLTGLGHDVVGVDRSRTMLAAARAADPSIEVHECDASALPFADGAFDLVVAFMSLQDIDDLGGALCEAARVLERGGVLCAAIVHPLASAGLWRDDAFVIDGSYLDESYFRDSVARAGLDLTLTSRHRPLEAYVDAVGDAGFVVERLREPAEPAGKWSRVPNFLYLRASKPGA